MNGSRHLLLLAPVLGLFGCAAPDASDRAFRSSYDSGDIAAGAGDLASRPLAVLPAAAGPVLAVRLHQDQGRITQDVIYPGSDGVPGENRVTVTRVDLRDPGAAGIALADGRMTEAALDDAFNREFPGVPMRPAAEPLPTRAGPMGYASGSRGRTTCVLAWLSGEPRRLALADAFGRDGQSLTNLRVRVCRDASLDRVKDVVRDVRLADAATDDMRFPPAVSPAWTGRDAAEDGLDAGDARGFRHVPAVTRRRPPARIASTRPRHERAPRAAAVRTEDIPLPTDVAGAGEPVRAVAGASAPVAADARAKDLPFPAR